MAGLVLLLGASVAAWQLWPDGSTTSAQPQSSATVSPAESTSASLASATPSPTPTTEASKTVDASTAKAQQALEACKQKVSAGDKVIEEAKTGVGHWAAHVEAQRLADEGEIDLDEMKARFKETRLKGPGDQKRYRDAVNAYEEQDCSAVEDGVKAIAASLEKCASRSSDQEPVMSAGAKGMKDWASHLAAMQRNKMGHAADPQGVWLRAYRAAPTNINGFEDAIDNYHPPSC